MYKQTNIIRSKKCVILNKFAKKSPLHGKLGDKGKRILKKSIGSSIIEFARNKDGEKQHMLYLEDIKISFKCQGYEAIKYDIINCNIKCPQS